MPKALLPFPSEFMFVVAAELGQLGAKMTDCFASYDGLHWGWLHESRTGVGHADGNVWSRSSRREGRIRGESADVKMRDEGDGDEGDDEDDEEEEEEEKAIRFEICLRPLEADAQTAGQVEVKIRWVEGIDHVLFESFCGMVKRKLTLDDMART